MESIIKAIESLTSHPNSKGVFSVIGTMISYVFGFNNVELWIVIGVLVVLDIITGVIKASTLGHEFTSRRMFDKLATVAVYGIVIAMVNMMIRACDCVSTGLCGEGIVTYLRDIVAFWIISTEIKSIIENLSLMGYKIPSKIEEFIQNIFGKDK